jgi:hypothetical protein
MDVLRILAELRQVFPRVEDEFDAIVAENGAVLADVDGVRDLAPAIDPTLAQALAHRDVAFRTGRVVLARDARHDATALEEVGRSVAREFCRGCPGATSWRHRRLGPRRGRYGFGCSMRASGPG